MHVSQYGGGMTSAQDFSKMRQQMFAKADTDGNGSVSLDEFKALGKNLPGGSNAAVSDDKVTEMFNKLDSDHDGKLTQQELEAARPKHHHRASPDMLLQAQQDGSSADQAQGLANILSGNDQKGASALVQKLQSLYANLTNPIKTSTATSLTA